MSPFDHPNMDNFVCPVCGTSDDKPVVLIGINGTQEDNIVEARQYHMDCIDLTEYQTSPNSRMIAMGFTPK